MLPVLIKNLRIHGKAPFSVAVIHGGPGAPGHMAPVARELANEWGVLEPLQTAASLEGQVQELRDVLETHGDRLSSWSVPPGGRCSDLCSPPVIRPWSGS